jgi:hypothetical protein
MTYNRRIEDRVSLNLSARWTGLTGQHEAHVVDVSLGGCFVTTLGRVDVGEIVALEIKLPSGEWLQLRGQVCSYQERIGYGVEFPFLTAEEEQTLRQLIA